MRIELNRVVTIAMSCWLTFGCTPSTPPAQEPVSAPTPNASGALSGASSSAGGSSVGGAATAGSPSDTGGIANVGGASDAHEKMCGGIAGIQCPAKQYCAFAPEARCGAADMSGTCAPIPDVCMHLVDPVCGCDGKTYGNSCHAAQAGVSITGKGPCATPDTTLEGGLCGTRGASRDCAPGLYCAYKLDCGTTDAGGTCSKKPTICTKIYRPVCGCDGKTYGSGCTAAAEGVSVVHDGVCKK